MVKDLNNDLYVFTNGSAGFGIDKLNSSGQVLWSKSAAGTANVVAYKIDGENNLIVLGNLASPVTIGNLAAQPNGERSFFILKVSPGSSVLQLNVYGSTEDTYATDLFINARGHYLIGGASRGSFDFNGTQISGDAFTRFFMIKTDASQHVLWWETNAYASPEGEAWIDELVETNSGIIYATFTCYGLLSYHGHNFGSSGQFLVKLDANRNIAWDHYLCYPAESFSTYSDLQLAADTLFMNMYFSHHGSSAYIYRWTPDGAQSSVMLANHHMAFGIHDNILYYASAGQDQPWTTQYYYRKMGRMNTGLMPVGTADSVVTSYAGYYALEVMNPGSLYITGYGDGMFNNFVGRYLLSGATGVAARDEAAIREVFPNPSSGLFCLPETADMPTLRVFDVNGTLINFSSRENRIDLSAYPAGVYFLRMKLNDGEVVWKKLVVQ